MRVNSLNEIIVILKNQKELYREFHIKKIGVFGSFARNEQTPNSDVDILFEYDDDTRAIGLFALARLRRKLVNIFGREVDLVTTGSLKGFIGDVILKEVIYIDF
ncbi:MAG: hypothetical protein H6Q69_954 [Firmicutes bacterium]|nr:hypothetical protein [Bacillota bacterium]